MAKKGPPANCRRCESPLTGGRYQCQFCDLWNLGNQLPKDGGDGTFLLSDVKSADLERINAGVFNYVWSGTVEKGPVKTSVTMLGGLPGAGKTTMVLQVLDLFTTETKLESGYIAAEMSPSEMKFYAERLRIKNLDKIRIIPAMTGTCNVGEVLTKYNFGIVVLDSLQGLVGEDDSASVDVCKVCKQHATDKLTPIVIISHVTKEGDYAGLMKLQHEVDTLMLITVDDATGIRTIEILKNRFGKAHITSEFNMTENGLIPYTKDEENDDEFEGD